MAKYIGITPKKSLGNMSEKDRTFRNKLAAFYNGKTTEFKKLAYLLPQYDAVRKMGGEYIKEFQVYQGKKGNKEEYFTIDTNHGTGIVDRLFVEGLESRLPFESFPTHIDLQERKGKNNYQKTGKEDIDWNQMIDGSESDDIVEFFRKKYS